MLKKCDKQKKLPLLPSLYSFRFYSPRNRCKIVSSTTKHPKRGLNIEACPQKTLARETALCCEEKSLLSAHSKGQDAQDFDCAAALGFFRAVMVLRSCDKPTDTRRDFSIGHDPDGVPSAGQPVQFFAGVLQGRLWRIVDIFN